MMSVWIREAPNLKINHFRSCGVYVIVVRDAKENGKATNQIISKGLTLSSQRAR